MTRSLAAVAGGFMAWFAVATLANLLLRVVLPGYVEVEKDMNFTLAMLVARLLTGIAASIAAGFVAAWIAAGRRREAHIVAALLLLLFVPVHISLWARFPLWYHAAFLLSLGLATAFGAWGRAWLSGGARAKPG